MPQGASPPQDDQGVLIDPDAAHYIVTVVGQNPSQICLVSSVLPTVLFAVLTMRVLVLDTVSCTIPKT